MMLAKGNVLEFNEIMAMSVENFLIRFKMHISEIEQIQVANQKIKTQRRG